MVYLIFAVVAVPILFFMFTWTAVTVYRLLFPEEPSLYSRDISYMRRRLSAKREGALVGVREIREDQRRYRDGFLCQRTYDYAHGASAGLPDQWLEDIHLRRN